MTINYNTLQFRTANLGATVIDYYWGYDCASTIVESISKLDADQYFVVTDQTVYDLYGEHFERILSRDKPTHILKSPVGEGYKSMKTLTSYLGSCFSNKITRNSLIIGLGGGIPGNVAGLLASLIYRGIKFVQIPTTSVAMFDSVLSLKQAINSDCSKNSIGSFYKPEAIYVDLSMLSTLPEAHRRSGLCETIKNALAIIPSEISLLRTHLRRAMEGDYEALCYILDSSILAKEKVMSDDTYEKRDAILLEYGHTIGHAIEIILAKSKVPYISHGEAVGLGMIVAAHISNSLELLDNESLDTHYQLLSEVSSPTTLNIGYMVNDILRLLLSDNKRGYIKTKNDEAAMILLRDLGQPIYTGSYPLTSVPLSLIKDSLRNIFESRKHVA